MPIPDMVFGLFPFPTELDRGLWSVISGLFAEGLATLRLKTPQEKPLRISTTSKCRSVRTVLMLLPCSTASVTERGGAAILGYLVFEQLPCTLKRCCASLLQASTDA